MSFSALLSFFFVYIPFNERSFARKGLSIARLDFQGSATNVIILHIHIHCVWLYSFHNKKSNYNSRYCIIPISHAFFFFIIEPGKFTNMTNREYRKCNHVLVVDNNADYTRNKRSTFFFHLFFLNFTVTGISREKRYLMADIIKLNHKCIIFVQQIFNAALQ